MSALADVRGGLERAVDRGWRGLGSVALGLVAGWWLYVPCHELLHVAGCLAAGGSVTRLELAPVYGGALLGRVLPFVAAVGGPTSRLSGFDTRGSDLVYLATDLAPFLLTLFPGVWALRTCGRSGRAFLFGAALPVALAPFVSILGDAYEIGSILVTLLPAWAGEGIRALLRGDDALGALARVAERGGARALLGFALAAAVGALWALATYALAGGLATRLGAPSRLRARLPALSTAALLAAVLVPSSGGAAASSSRIRVTAVRAVRSEPAPAAGRTVPSAAEIAEAFAIVRKTLTGPVGLFEPMPPVSADREGRRLVNVGVRRPEQDEIVSVHAPTGTVIHYPSGAPETSRAGAQRCGEDPATCPAEIGRCDDYDVRWPEPDPVWTLRLRHPACTRSIQPDGTGLALSRVTYKGRLILERAEVPVLNVVYRDDVCGPFRDWLFSEDCFQAEGADVPAPGSGVRIASTPPSTQCESGSDAGSFAGVALYDQGEALWLVTEMSAGWYRYIMEWRLHLDGTIEPIFGFGATSNGCTCFAHTHHAYWRLEWAIDGAPNEPPETAQTGVTVLERLRSGRRDGEGVPAEATFVRAPSGEEDVWTVRNPATGNGYLLRPGARDGGAAGDAFAKWDVAALALHAGEIDDPNVEVAVALGPWLNGEPLGAGRRLVTWYHAAVRHDPELSGEVCELVGPTLVPLASCAGRPGARPRGACPLP